MNTIISPCGKYRYILTRNWEQLILKVPLVILTWVMLNPSTADAEKDDQTVRKVIGFSKQWGYNGIIIVNLFAFRTTNPKELIKVEDPIGPGNEEILRKGIFPLVIVGWGSNIPKTQKADYLARIIRERAKREDGWFCLGLTKIGEPRHPLMLPYNTERIKWPI